MAREEGVVCEQKKESKIRTKNNSKMSLNTILLFMNNKATILCEDIPFFEVWSRYSKSIAWKYNQNAYTVTNQ